MHKMICKSCSATKDIEEFDGFKTCNKHAVKRKENATVETRRSIIKHEEQREQRGTKCAKNAVIK